jgi:hypothetical protein
MSVLSVANEQLKCSPKPLKILEIFLSNIFRYLSNTKKIGKMREVFVDQLVLQKNLSQLFEIQF